MPNKPKANRKKDIIRITAEANKIENKKIIQKILKSESWFFEKINKIDKPIGRVTKRED